MVFSSTVFLFIFLPIVLFLNFSLAPRFRNLLLLCVSLVFYAWGEGILVVLMILSTCVNYLAGLCISGLSTRKVLVKIVLGIAIAINLLFLCYYKYLNFFIEIFPAFDFLIEGKNPIILPIGISFYTFHGISYLVDIYRKGLPGIKNPIDLGLYIAFFPQLVAGPIVRYSDIAEQLRHRSINLPLFYEGCIRFIRGLAKKVIFANTLGIIADQVFNISSPDLPTGMAWLGIICYTLQIYFDFSGYSDMAIGLAKMFGFTFKENFDHPYIAKSIQDFWRRWHISLSSWFRDYVYISIGGNRKGVARTYINLLFVFFLTGLWHGANWSFIIWGMYHGLFIILERVGVFNTDRWPRIVKHSYVVLVVIIGWVFFRANSGAHAIRYLKSMFGLINGDNYIPLIYVNTYTVTVLITAILFVTPLREYLSKLAFSSVSQPRARMVIASIIYFSLFLYAIGELAQASYNPFIYFRF
ncbi:MAG TPA: MBOAT family protein [Cyclobacteriaceae bacterium]|nr:MBOAT family protein [Cyclobacteriaceae bacterium]